MNAHHNLAKWFPILIVSIYFVSICACKKKEDSPPTPVPETCTDGIKNQDETGIDCGGSNCLNSLGQVTPCGAFQYIGAYHTSFSLCSDNENSLWFINQNTAFIAAVKNKNTNLNSGTVQRSTDGGANWSEVKESNYPLYSIFFASPTIGFAVGDSADFLKTTDGGSTWNESVIYPTNITGNFYVGFEQVYFLNTNTGFILYNTNAFLKTDDGGATWQRITPVNTQNHYKTIQFVNSTTGFMFSEPSEGTIYKTINAGSGWGALNFYIPNINSIQCGSFFDENVGYILVTRGYPYEYLIFKTTDGGNTWVEKSEVEGILSGNAKFNILAVSQNEVWITATNGAINGSKYLLISHSTDGAATWQVNSILHDNHCQNFPASISSIFYLAPTFYCLTGDGFVLKN